VETTKILIQDLKGIEL